MKQSLSAKIFLLSLKVVWFINKLIGNLFAKNYDVILCYHDVGNKKWEFSVSKKQFESHIRALSKIAKVVSLNEMVNKLNLGNLRVAITFDDGYEGVYTNALSILKKYGQTAAVFVVDTKNISSRTKYNSKLLNKRQILALKKSSWDIGFHTSSHIDVSNSTKDELINEIKEGKKKLEKKLGFKIKYFAYPFGRNNAAGVNVVKESGFKQAFTVNGDKYSQEDSAYLKSRITVSTYMDENDLAALISPLGILVNKYFTKVWQIKDRLIK